MSISERAALSGTLAFDTQNLEQLKLAAKNDPGKAAAGTAKQFEALFLGMVLKSMREATPQDGMFDNEQTKMYTSLLDQQLAQHISARGTGLAEVMARQLTSGISTAKPPSDESLPMQKNVVTSSRATALSSKPNVVAEQSLVQAMWSPQADSHGGKTNALATPKQVKSAMASTELADQPRPEPRSKTRAFIDRVWQHAVDAAQSTGIKPQFMVGQAALETGWGKHEMRNVDGTSTYNLFGIKAGPGWTGAVVERTTTEYVNGVAQKSTEKFRVYSSYAESFRDYASLLNNNKRYKNVLAQSIDAPGFARSLQKSGYATDPAYAEKLVRVIDGYSLRQAMNNFRQTQVAARIDVKA